MEPSPTRRGSLRSIQHIKGKKMTIVNTRNQVSDVEQHASFRLRKQSQTGRDGPVVAVASLGAPVECTDLVTRDPFTRK